MADVRELALINLGLIMDGRASLSLYTEQDFPAPYSRVISTIKKHPESVGNKEVVDSLIASLMMPDEIVEAHTQAARYNGLGEEGVFAWRKALIEANVKLTVGDELDRFAKECRANKDVDYLKVYSRLGSLITSGTTGPKPANQIDYKSYRPYMKSGINYIDDIIGGWPTDGPIVVLAAQGMGKSHFGFFAACNWLLKHTDKQAAVYTLEMSDKHFLSREIEMYPEFKPIVECENSRLHISSTCRGVDEISAEVSTGKYGFVVIDAIKQLAKGGDTSVYDKTYQTIVEICRFQEIPVMVMHHSNREGKKSGKFISTYDAYMSGAAEDAAAMLLSLNIVSYADPDWVDTRFVPVEVDNPQKTDRFYMCFWKFRDNRPVETQQGLGAIRIEPDKHTGYYKQIWVGNALGNKLWPVSYKRPQSIGAPQQVSNENKPTLRLNRI